MLLQRSPGHHLRRRVGGYWGFDETTARPTRRREGPGSAVVLILSFGNAWVIDGEPRGSFVGGLRSSQVTTEHSGWSRGMHIDLAPWAAHALFRIPMHELAQTTVPLDALLPFEIVERLEDAPTWDERFEILDELFARWLLDTSTRPALPEVIWAWERLRSTDGRVRVASIASELGWSRKRLVSRFREQIGLPPKAAARLLRFERARRLAGTMSWGDLAFACGYADQPHLIAEFRAFTGRTPETFLQDAAAQAE